MGMNYYVKLKDRKVNQRDLHIGKNSAGWEFSFQGYEVDEYYNIPQLKSKQEWFEYIFLYFEDSIYNEENENITFHKFANIVNGTKNKGLSNHYDYLKKQHDYESLKDCFKDEDGFSISMGEFE